VHLVEIETPKKYLLNGVWFGPKKPKRVVIWIHGLTGSLFSTKDLRDSILKADIAILSFNNRGFGKVNTIKRKVGGKLKSVLGGSAHEVFTDCVDDIQGAVNFCRKAAVKEIYLAGHSTGCQKAVYWASKKGKNVEGIILLSPVSDHAAAAKDYTKSKLIKAVKHAQKLVRAGKKHELMPKHLLTHWSFDDAQRFLSLYTPDSKETIFPYEQKGKIPRTLRLVKIPTLVLWAEHDEYADRTAKEIASWFAQNIRSPHNVVIVPKANHQFKGQERKVAAEIRKFIKDIK
jgi:alpha-beta hydrolase superfamily lysophospholipase